MTTVKMMRVRAQDVLRRTGTLGWAEQVRFRLKTREVRRRNEQFLRDNPGFPVPPADLAFDAYSAPDWAFYKESGAGTAAFLASSFTAALDQSGPLRVLEWGCGPGRVIRHLPGLLPEGSSVFGCDYNPDTVRWCTAALPDIEFALNGLQPPLPFADESFDAVYCISVFTHLAEETSLAWAADLVRVLRPGGILIATTSGDSAYSTEMLPREQRDYDTHGVVVRGEYEEGKKMFLARHSPDYVRSRLLKDLEIVDHRPAGFPYIAQDCWIARKPA